ncbi:MAG: 3-isopropylmalate dehydratase small subunit [Candidatus Auribacter fodinae]|jgi:3-isopropylmalate dehydratase small subunit|uniref:3-isopropylmalate dehydratase small subunit n=1 Tax=Candidatus Auribacter fodinae TaxID=2093366 RepID=A0A3A4QVM1_9BACT|nr:MAG: 3-isopropylmalate dehydratase small subunit [Candidatus Auribacter fodinae]
MKIQGKVWKFGDDIDTDVIIPARYLNTTDPAELAKHCMEDADTQFASKVQKGDIIVAGKNFGCGSSREHAPISIKASGIGCVVASSFARIFFRNSFNTGLPIFESEEASAGIRQGDVISVDFETGIIVNTTRNQTYQSQPLPEFMQELLNAGGLMNYVRNKK